MSPKSFTFKLTVPRDPEVAPIVTDLASHAVGYAGLPAAAGTALVAQVAAAAAGVLATTGPPVLIVVTSDETTLTFAIDGVPVSMPHSN